MAQLIRQPICLLSVNQMNAQIKITDMWKALNNSYYPTKIKNKTSVGDASTTRSVTSGLLVESANFSNLSRSTFINAKLVSFAFV